MNRVAVDEGRKAASEYLEPWTNPYKHFSLDAAWWSSGYWKQRKRMGELPSGENEMYQLLKKVNNGTDSFLYLQDRKLRLERRT